MELIPGGTLDEKIMGAPAARARGAAPGHPARAGPGGRARRGRRPPRPQARQRAHHARRPPQDPRLRPGHAAPAGVRREGRTRPPSGENAWWPARRPTWRRSSSWASRWTPARDIYAAGAVLYEMATGRRPFADVARRAAHRRHPAPAAGRRRATSTRACRRAWRQIVLKCLDKDPHRRYQSARELLVDLERLCVPSAVTRPPAARRSGSTRPGRAGGRGGAGRAGRLAAPAAPRAPGERPGRRRPSVRWPCCRWRTSRAIPRQEYFADGMTDALIADLGRSSARCASSRAPRPCSTRARASRCPRSRASWAWTRWWRARCCARATACASHAQLVHAASDRQLWARQLRARPARRDGAAARGGRPAWPAR